MTEYIPEVSEHGLALLREAGIECQSYTISVSGEDFDTDAALPGWGPGEHDGVRVSRAAAERWDLGLAEVKKRGLRAGDPDRASLRLHILRGCDPAAWNPAADTDPWIEGLRAHARTTKGKSAKACEQRVEHLLAGLGHTTYGRGGKERCYLPDRGEELLVEEFVEKGKYPFVVRIVVAQLGDGALHWEYWRRPAEWQPGCWMGAPVTRLYGLPDLLDRERLLGMRELGITTVEDAERRLAKLPADRTAGVADARRALELVAAVAANGE